MRMTSRKKEILSFYEPDNLEWVTGEIGPPPLDVSGVSYEQRQDTTQSGGGNGVWCNVSRYALPGSCVIMRDDGGKREAIDGEVVRID